MTIKDSIAGEIHALPAITKVAVIMKPLIYSYKIVIIKILITTYNVAPNII